VACRQALPALLHRISRRELPRCSPRSSPHAIRRLYTSKRMSNARTAHYCTEAIKLHSIKSTLAITNYLYYYLYYYHTCGEREHHLPVTRGLRHHSNYNNGFLPQQLPRFRLDKLVPVVTLD
jgi:hypothetical protein